MKECKICNKKTNELESHHIVPKSRGGGDDDSNMILLCLSCHSKAHDVSFSGRKGLISDGVKKYQRDQKSSQVWYEQNENFILDKLSKLHEEDEKKYNLILALMEFDLMPKRNLREVLTNGCTKLKINRRIRI